MPERPDLNATLRVRVAAPSDAAELLSIYAPYVEKTAVTFELAVPTVEEFERRIAKTLERYPYLVVETAGRWPDEPPEIVGYAYAGPFKTRAAYDWAVETSVYVREDMRRCGIGGMLYRALEAALRAQGVLNMNACIAYPAEEDEYVTHTSTRFHESFGFRMVGVFRQCGHKFGRWYDVSWMEKHLADHPDGQQPPIRPFGEIAGSLFAPVSEPEPHIVEGDDVEAEIVVPLADAGIVAAPPCTMREASAS